MVMKEKHININFRSHSFDQIRGLLVNQFDCQNIMKLCNFGGRFKSALFDEETAL